MNKYNPYRFGYDFYGKHYKRYIKKLVHKKFRHNTKLGLKAGKDVDSYIAKQA